MPAGKERAGGAGHCFGGLVAHAQLAADPEGEPGGRQVDVGVAFQRHHGQARGRDRGLSGPGHPPAGTGRPGGGGEAFLGAAGHSGTERLRRGLFGQPVDEAQAGHAHLAREVGFFEAERPRGYLGAAGGYSVFLLGAGRAGSAEVEEHLPDGDGGQRSAGREVPGAAGKAQLQSADPAEVQHGRRHQF